MRVLLVLKQDRNLAAFGDTVRELLARGHEVRLAVQERNDARDARLVQDFDSPLFGVAHCPAVRLDAWEGRAATLRSLRDALHYLQPPLRSTGQLRDRIVARLWQQLPVAAGAEAMGQVLDALSPAEAADLEALMALAEQALPTEPLFDEFLEAERPDLLLLSPLVHFGSPQTDLVASARRLGIPVSMLLYSWDNLSTKGCLHRTPDWMVVWNEVQRQEAMRMHGFPAERVIVAGAPRFDAFFALTPQLSRADFHTPLGLDPARPTILYLCSSRIICDDELAFLREWLRAVRTSSHAELREANVVVRPHPDVELLPDGVSMERHTWPARPGLGAHVARPFDDPGVVVLRTAYHTPQGLFESITHSTLVVGLNTTAELEAGIVGRPVFSIHPSTEVAGGQKDTLHFHYLTVGQGGFVSVAPTVAAHVDQVATALRDGTDPAVIRAFVERFLRPRGIGQPVAPILADEIERMGAAPRPVPGRLEPDGSSRLPAAGPDLLRLPKDVFVEDERPVMPVAAPRTALQVYATPVARRRARLGAVPVDRETLRWMQDAIELGEVVYDIGAAVGAYALLAARSRGAVVVAFEGGFAAYAALCDNLFLNEMELSVLPVPAVLGDQDGLGELKFKIGHLGGERFGVFDTRWRVRPAGRRRSFLQPSLLSRLDTLVERHGLPLPQHIRFAPRTPVAAIVAGAGHTLRQPSLKSLCLFLQPDEEASSTALFRDLEWEVTARRDLEVAVHLVLGRAAGLPGNDVPA